MSTAYRSYPDEQSCFELRSGDSMTREEFHQLYEKMPEDFKAELLGGIVYVASPLKNLHSKNHMRLSSIFDAYEAATPGVQAGDNATVFLSKTDEVQPDLFLRILPKHGGQTRDTNDGYIAGAPELIGEIAYSSRSVDLHIKRKRYAKAGVIEYLVVCLDPREIYWFDFRTGRTLEPDSCGILRSRVFPGLWVGSDALIDLEYAELMETLKQGLATSDHLAFVNRLLTEART